MTLVIRSTDALATPPEGSKVLPALAGVTGVLGRFHADYFTGAHGESVVAWPDSSDNGRNLSDMASGVTASIDTTTTAERTVNLTGSGAFKSANLPTSLPAATIGFRAYIPANPSLSQYIASLTGTASMSLLALTWGGYGARGSAGNYPQSAAVAKPAWVTVIGVFDTAAPSAGKVVTNGTTVSGSQDFTGLTADRALGLSGGGHAAGVMFREVVFLDHAADVAEVAALTTALNAS